MIEGGKALAGCLLCFSLASSVTKALASWSCCLTARFLPVLCLVDGCLFYDWFEAESWSRVKPVPERYRGGSTLSPQARATIMKFALPVLGQGDLPLFRELRFTPEPACKERRAGAACSFCPAKSVTAWVRTQAGAAERKGATAVD